MMTVLATTGREVVVRQMNDGTPVINLALAYNIGYGQSKKTQWIETSIFGKKAESLAPHLPKGTRVMITLNEIHIDEYVKQDGASTPKLVGRFIDLAFAGGGEKQESKPKQQSKPDNQPAGGAPDFDMDSIPF